MFSCFGRERGADTTRKRSTKGKGLNMRRWKKDRPVTLHLVKSGRMGGN